MSDVRPARIAVAAGLVLALASRDAIAGHACDGVRLDVSDELSPAWQEAGRQLRTELVGSDAPCVSATLLVEPVAGGARLSATSADGRHTERMLRRASTLVPTALGIVASLPPESRSVPPEAIAAEARVATPEIDPIDTAPALPADPTPQVWVGANLGARVGAPTPLGMMGVGGSVTLESKRWLVATSFRYGTSFGESAVSTDDSYYEIVVGLGLGRRISVGGSSLDIVLSPSVSSASLNDNDDGEGPSAPPRIAGRLGASLTWWRAFKDGSRVTLTADSDVAPYGLLYGLHTTAGEPLMPAWTAGISLGAAGRIL